MIKEEISAFMRADFHLFDALKELETLLLPPGLLVGLDVLRMSPRCGGSRSTWTRPTLLPDLRCSQVFQGGYERSGDSCS